MNVFKFSESKSLLRSFISSLPMKGRGEISRIARHLRVSPTLVSQVLSGDKIFTPEQTHALVGYLELTPIEAEYFTFMVQKERAGTRELQKFWELKMGELKSRALTVATRVSADRVLSESEKSVFYSSPLYAAISLFTSVGPNGKSESEICERFDLSRVKAAEILEFLTRTDLCREKDGRYFMGAQKTHLEDGSAFVLRHHSNWRLRAIRHGEDLDKQELMYTAPVSLSRKDFDHLRESMVEFIKDFLAKVHDSPAEDIACFNMDFFWIKK